MIQREGSGVHFDIPIRVAQRERLDTETLLAIFFRNRTIDRKVDFTPDHLLDKFICVDILYVASLNASPLPKNCHTIAKLHNLIQFMADKHDGATSVAHFTKNTEKRPNLLRRQNSSRLVENKDPRAAIENLKNFNRLLFADRKLIRKFVRVNFHAVFLGKCTYGRTFFLVAHKKTAGGNRDILRGRQRFGEHEMLVNHADSALDGIFGGMKDLSLSADKNGSRIRLIDAG